MKPERKQILIIQLLILDYYDSDPSSDGQEYYETLVQIICTAHLSNSTFDAILHYSHQLRSRSPKLTSHALETFILQRLTNNDKADWFEKALVAFIGNSTTSFESLEDIGKLRGLLDTLLTQRARHMISPVMVHAAQMVRMEHPPSPYG